MHPSDVLDAEEAWIPFVDEPIGAIVDEIQSDHPRLLALRASPRRLRAFRTFAYIRVGVLLGQLLVDHEPDLERSATWVEQLLRDPENRARVEREVLAVGAEVATDPRLAGEEPVGPDEEVRARFREFVRSLAPPGRAP